ncbi:FAD-dependent oxidoreductase [Candidatus Pelagibacter sp.]|nr:FAD-dependent oxidoreductase [Candidatus Pelagibacter sp.]
MLIDYSNHNNDENIESQICIIGAGAAGITLALELSKKKFDIVLVESGDFKSNDTVQNLYAGYNTGKEYPIESSRLRYFGGTTNHWGGMCRPLDEHDFIKKDYVNYSGWPFSYNELKPFYSLAHNYLELGKYDYSIDHGRELKKSFRQCLLEKSVIIEKKLFKRSTPVRYLKKYKKNITKNKYIRCYNNINIINLHLSNDKQHCNEAHGVSIDGFKLNFKSKFFIICMGGIETPRLLLNSSKQEKKGFGNINGLVGKFFQEHPHLYSGELLLNPKLDPSKFFDCGGDWMNVKKKKPTSIWPIYTLTSEIQLKEKILNGSISLRGNLSNKSIIKSNNPLLKDYMEKMTSNIFGHRKNSKLLRIPIFSRTESSPNPNSKITLSNKKDILGQYKINLNWELNELDFKSIYKTLEYFNAEANRLNIGRVQINYEDTKEKFEFWGGQHHMGTTRMHTSAKQGVVNENLRMHNVDNVYISGSSVFPTSGFANPTLTIVALSIRLASYLSKKIV